jgi:hypothetical protein
MFAIRPLAQHHPWTARQSSLDRFRDGTLVWEPRGETYAGLDNLIRLPSQTLTAVRPFAYWSTIILNDFGRASCAGALVSTKRTSVRQSTQ